ncbi:Membrane-bound lytic murein transglycosylase F [Streptomyces sp. RB5]|uniref:Membrane-bound lytic murein transglycosylase F n=1 Tax=Streptomyces smaragdinus TaxID=2585196 RepID=A0A7K0CNT5_9ACTN|nr:NlpC/P60 family protein [Streptomyces smaragdinus]MQY15145.1 Membrane-bound lytic murein transglycosylase F [Streptomyces smaragdinus]
MAVDEDRPAYATGALRIGPDAVPPRYATLIIEAAAACDQGLPAPVLAAQIYHESHWNPTAQSPAGAQGVSQFMPTTWRSSGYDANADGRTDIHDPADAIPSQARMMCKLLRTAKRHPHYNGSPIELALAAYNAGWGRVTQFHGVPPPSFANGETYNYVRNILTTSRRFTTTAPAGEAALPSGFTLPTNAPTPVRTAIAWALQQRGGPYHLGGDCTNALGTDPAHWCDCSSLMQQAYHHAGITIPRTTYDQVNTGTTVALDAPKPGDLIFNPGSDGSDSRPGHVGMYIGEDLVLEAPRTGLKTRLVSYTSWRTSTTPTTRVTAIRRIVTW